MIQYQSSGMLKLFNLHNTNILLKTNSCEVCWQGLQWLGTAGNNSGELCGSSPEDLCPLLPCRSSLYNHRGWYPTAAPSRGDQRPLAGRIWHRVLVMIKMITPRVKMQGFVLVLSFSDCTFDLLTCHSYEFSHLRGMESERSRRALFKWKHRLSAKVSNLAPCSKPRAVPEVKCCCLSAVSHIILTLITSHFIWL